MPQTMKLEDGNEIEVFTAEELEAQKQEAIEAFRAENPDKTEELTKAQLELEKYRGKDLNFENLRKQKAEAEKKVEDILKGVDDRVSKVKNEVLDSVMKDHYTEVLKGIVGEDEEVKKKVELAYKEINRTTTTKDEITSKLRDAYLLATKKTDFDAMNSSVISSGGVSRLNFNSNKKALTPEEQAMAKNFGLSQDDLKKYS